MSTEQHGTTSGGDAPSTMTIDRFAARVVPVEPTARCAEVYERFSADSDLLTVPVVDRERPVGLVYRGEFEHRLAHTFGRALYERKEIALLMDPSPLIVERDIRLEALQSVIATDRPSALLRGFIIAERGRYLAMGSALSLLKASLVHREERARELERAYAAAASASNMKSSFLANMSHELRTPLNAIIGFSEVMRNAPFGPLEPRYRQYAEDILASGKHLLDLVNDLLDMAKIEAGRFELHETLFPLKDTVHAVVRMLGETAVRGNLTVNVDLHAAADVHLRADERELRQMLLNLLSNALKFTPAKGRVSVQARCDGDGGMAIDVIDTGIGMSEQEIAVALTPFGQISSDLSRRYPGTGLGLPLVKSLTELHGGRLEIASRQGAGTRATIRLPARRVRSGLEVGALALPAAE